MGIDQASRAVRINTALPDNTLALKELSGSECLSELFNYKLDCVSEDAEIDLYAVLGQPITIALEAQGGDRYINGLVAEAAHLGSWGEYALYQLSVTAWPWMLTHNRDCRIFSNRSVPDIIVSLFSEKGFSDVDNRLVGTYDPWNHCVQYQESDFAFISRLMEHEGIYYYFEHSDGRHTLVLADDVSAHQTAPGYASIPHYPSDTDTARRKDYFSQWQFEKRVQSGQYATKDFAFDQPRRDLFVKQMATSGGDYPSLEVYDYPGGYAYKDSGEMTRSYGERLAKARIEALTSDHEMALAKGNVRGLTAGHIFNLTECLRQDQNREYRVVQAKILVLMDNYYSTEPGVVDEVVFQSQLDCMPSVISYRPRRKTVKPEIRGPQTAIVVGPSGEEIWTDSHGRVKLQFHWDRYGKSDQNSSCWVRVSQVWAGEKWGSIHIPRIGQEVIVEYIDGDPDRPIITGRVYNGDRPVPYDLPANATQSGIKSRSSKSGTPANFNEIRMEDKKGSEEIYIHAEKDQNNVVENDETTFVGRDRTENIGRNETITIGNDRTESVGNNETISIKANRKEDVGVNETIAIGKNRTESVGRDEEVSIGSNRSHNIGSNDSLEVGKNSTITIGDNLSETVGKTIRVTAGDEIVFTTGRASITMKKDGTIVLSGKDISINGSGVINAKANKNIVMKGKKILQN